MVKNVHPDPADLGSAANQAGTSSTTEESEKNNGMQSRRGKRITWTRFAVKGFPYYSTACLGYNVSSLRVNLLSKNDIKNMQRTDDIDSAAM